MKYFFHFLQIWVEKKIYSTVILHYMIFLSRGENEVGNFGVEDTL